MDPVSTFREEVKRNWRGDLKGPFNVEDREKAGMSREFYENLSGEMEGPTSGNDGLDMKSLSEAVAAVPVGYEINK